MAADQRNIHFAPPDRRIPMRPCGTIKASASPTSQERVGAERDRHPS
ncbi:MAG: hypothetical protein K8R06_02930 [Methanosarcinales archaeon]|nr:hypothetical protein [Methanosarcinales archaeon]